MFAYRSKCLRMAPLGFSCDRNGSGYAALSCGPSSQPSRPASASIVAGGMALPCSSMAEAPSGSSCQATGSAPAAARAASTTRTDAGTISGPMPSPSITPRR